MYSSKLSGLVVLLLVTLVCSQDWCNQQGCTSTHIGCNNNGAWSSRCVGQSQVTITAAQRNLILDTHNQLRSRIALGQQPRFSTARRMAQMVWNNDLAYLAELNTRTCQMAHDPCRNTPAFRWAGQNLGASGTSGPFTAPNTVIVNTINSWYNEHQFAAQSDINTFTRLYNGQNAIGHFTVMVSERNTQVGCAISNYVSGGWNWTLLACNYATTNMMNQNIYRTGTTGSGCTLGRDPTYTGLCRTNEPIDPNSFA
ncbi:unnamed protein product [Diamesa serratosioi]